MKLQKINMGEIWGKGIGKRDAICGVNEEL
jgi:hypothetical protein